MQIRPQPTQPNPLQPSAALAHHSTNPAKELSSRFEKCETEDLVEVIASMLTRLVIHNDQIPFASTSLTRFHSRSPPAISISDYLRRICRYTNPEPICLILILNYIDRICKNLVNFTICSLTVHRFCITSVTVGSKFICDSFYSNSRYAKVGGISLTEINLLEREFLLAIDYRLSTTNEELNKYYLSLVDSHPSYKIVRTSITTANVAPHDPAIDQNENQLLGQQSSDDQEEHVERESKRLRRKDLVNLDQQTKSPVEKSRPENQQHLTLKTPPLSHPSPPNILPDSIVED